MDGSGPVSVTATGVDPSKKPNCYNCHPHFAVTYRYADGTHLITSSDGENGNRFIGDEGWIFVSRERIEASDPKLIKEPLHGETVRLYVSNDHMGNFIDGIRTRKRPICDVEVGYRSVTVCHLGAIALRLGIPLDWDPKAEHFVGPRADKGNAMIHARCGLRGGLKFELKNPADYGTLRPTLDSIQPADTPRSLSAFRPVLPPRLRSRRPLRSRLGVVGQLNNLRALDEKARAEAGRRYDKSHRVVAFWDWAAGHLRRERQRDRTILSRLPSAASEATLQDGIDFKVISVPVVNSLAFPVT